MSYDGSWPSLCSGELILEIDGKKYSFGNGWVDEYGMEWENDFFPFWESGGCIDRCSDVKIVVNKKAWKIDHSKIPEQFRKYEKEIENVFNENVEWGCCGGCI